MKTDEEIFRIALIGAVIIFEYLCVLVAVLADLWSGIRKARRRGEARRSKMLRLTVDKLARYYNALLALTVVDAMQISLAEFVRLSCQWSVPTLPLFTVAGALGIALIEVKSIYEKADEKAQSDYRDAATTMAQLLKELKDSKIINPS